MGRIKYGIIYYKLRIWRIPSYSNNINIVNPLKPNGVCFAKNAKRSPLIPPMHFRAYSTNSIVDIELCVEISTKRSFWQITTKDARRTLDAIEPNSIYINEATF